MKNNVLFFTVLLCNLTLLAQQPKSVKPLPAEARSAKAGVTTRAVVIGISDYQDKDIPDLRFADKDAEAFANFLYSPAGGSLDADHLKLLLNSQATMAQFAKALDWLMENIKEGDQAIIYFSGHGDVEKKTLTQPGYLLCWDAPSQVYMAGGAFKLGDLQEVISTLSIQNKAKVVVITDACRSGSLAGNSVGGAQATAASLTKQFANEIKILSCQPDEYSIEGEQWGGGRGAFSFNLVDALYGLADQNNDLFVTLQEVGRYLEDHVTAEVAPLSQVPMVLGSRTERLAVVDAQLLTDLRTGKTSQMALLMPIELRGLEDKVLADVDSNIWNLYQLFNESLKNKAFFEPSTACADVYYEQLIREPNLVRLHPSIRRNYAAALQDGAQQIINIFIKTDVQQLECLGKSVLLEPIPRLLDRAAELLGEEHYMYRSMIARKLLFESMVFSWNKKNPDGQLADHCLKLCRQSLALEPQSPLPWYMMSKIYLDNLRLPDSAFICAREACKIAPNWVLPYVDLGNRLSSLDKFNLAKQALKESEAINPNHPYVINQNAIWHYLQNGQSNIEKAVELFEKYRVNGGQVYTCWNNSYGNALQLIGKYAESEKEYFNSIAMDSTESSTWDNLGLLYSKMGRYVEAEPALKKAVSLDSTNATAWSNLGNLYSLTGRYTEAEEVEKKAIFLDSTNVKYWLFLSRLYHKMNKVTESEQISIKAISIDSTYAASWHNLASLYMKLGRNAEAEPLLKKGISLDSTVAVLWNDLGMVSYFLKYPEADQFIKKAISLDSTYTTAWNNLGALYLFTGHYLEAQSVLKKSSAMDSTFATPYKYLGMAYLKTNQIDDARQAFLKSLKINPNYGGGLLGLAYILVLEKKLEEALRYVEQAIQKGITFEQLQNDTDLAPLRERSEQWQLLMKKHFPDKAKD
ncbi:MAG: tetratricopeptide repeat protein [Saprospiraceae bacterium]